MPVEASYLTKPRLNTSHGDGHGSVLVAEIDGHALSVDITISKSDRSVSMDLGRRTGRHGSALDSVCHGNYREDSC